MAIEWKDPATGKIKPVFIIAGVGIGGLVLFLLLGKSSSSSGVTSGGQSGDNTDALTGLQDALTNLGNATGGGGGSSSSAGTSSGGASGDSGGGGVSSAPSGASSSDYTQDVPIGDSNVAPSVGDPYSARLSVPGGETMTPINTYPAAANTPVAVNKPSNSGLSSAPVVHTPVASPQIVIAAPGGGPKSVASKPSGNTKAAPAPVKPVLITAKSVATKAGTAVTATKPTTVASTAVKKPVVNTVSTGGKKNPSATI